VSAGILFGITTLFLLYPTFAQYIPYAQNTETLRNWFSVGAVTATNTTAILTVNSTSTNSIISENISVNDYQTLVLTWIDSANLREANYQVKVLQEDKVIESVFSASEPEDWLSYNETLKIPHSVNLDLPAGQYMVIFALHGTNGAITLSEVSISTSIPIWLARKIEATTPILLVFAIAAGMAAITSHISSLKKDVERLKTLLSLKG
jgi:hypothetical protein